LNCVKKCGSYAVESLYAVTNNILLSQRLGSKWVQWFRSTDDFVKT